MHTRVVSSLAASGAVAVLLLSAVPARADVFGEYRIPAQSYRLGQGQLGLSASRSKSGSELSGTESRTEGGYGSLWGSFRSGFDSDPRAFSWTVSSGWSSDAARSQRADHGPTSMWGEHDDRDQSHTQTATLGGALRLNPGGGLFGFEFDGGATGDWGQGWSRDDGHSLYIPTGDQTFSRSSTQHHRYAYSASLTGAAGLGRVRSVSVVEDVHILEERLRGAGVLVRPLTPGAREKLAHLLAAAGTIGSAHERPERYRWREIERVLAEDGALGPGGLDAWAVLRANEGVMGRVFRRHGHFVGLAVQLRHDHEIQRSDLQDGSRYVPAVGGPTEYRSESGARAEYEYDRAFAGVTAEWHRPVGWAWQWDATGEAFTSLRSGDEGWLSTAQLGGSWHVADRWLATAGSTYMRSYYSRRDSDHWLEDRWSARQDLGLSYFLEDHLSFSVTLSDVQDRRREAGYYGGTMDRYNRHQRLSAGIGWRFLGRAEAPGVFGPMTALD